MKDRYLNERAVAQQLRGIDETSPITTDTFELIERSWWIIDELCDEAEMLMLELEQLKRTEKAA